MPKWAMVGAEQDKDKPPPPGAIRATLDELENSRDAVWAGNGCLY